MNSNQTCKCSNPCSLSCHRTRLEERQPLFVTAQHSYSSASLRRPETTSLRISSPRPCPRDSLKATLSTSRSSASKTNSRWAIPRPLVEPRATTQEATQSVGKTQKRDLRRSSRPTTRPSWRICSLCATQRASIDGKEVMIMGVCMMTFIRLRNCLSHLSHFSLPLISYSYQTLSIISQKLKLPFTIKI